ncbi:DHHW family protein [Cohnella soli]|uniref:DHHW family protein n=1 Tax=Cohnella soli TaxID=425005 RepID=A0ABW0HW10_9BACL
MINNKSERSLAVGFVATLFLLSLTFILSPVVKFSELENRYLQAVPRLTWDNLMSKKFADDTEKFVTDHFPLRGDWVSVKSAFEQMRLQQENNGIYKGKDGYLFEKFSEPDAALVAKYADVVKQFAAMHPETNVAFMLVPTSVGMYPERLPWKAPNYPQKNVNDAIADRLQGIGNLTYMDGFEFLRPHATENLYYRTDHHWKTLGAYYAYEAYARQMGWKPLSITDFDVTTVSESFLGSFHTRGQFSMLKPDEIQAFVPKKQTHTEVYVADTDETLPSLYDDSFLRKKDQYSYFLGGVHALMKLKSDFGDGQADLDKLLVVKDSYAHAFLPFLTQHVKEIHVIDIRYYNGSIADYMKANGITNTLMLFNTATFVGNTEIMKIDN